MDLTGDDVQDILHLLDSMPFGELQLETASFKLTIRRADGGGWTQDMQVLAEPRTLADAQGPVTTSPALSEPAAAAQEPPPPGGGPQSGLADVRAPLLGTFYRAPRPGAPPFVDVGSVVQEHTVVGIIETMKLMNSVAAGVSGTVTEILHGNAQFAEQGAVLMRVRPSR